LRLPARGRELRLGCNAASILHNSLHFVSCARGSGLTAAGTQLVLLGSEDCV